MMAAAEPLRSPGRARLARRGPAQAAGAQSYPISVPAAQPVDECSHSIRRAAANHPKLNLSNDVMYSPYVNANTRLHTAEN
jgi:hypothetical protein